MPDATSFDEYFAPLLEEQGLLGTILHHAKDFIAVLDRDQRMRYLNRLAPGFSMDQVIGTPFHEFNDPSYHDLIREKVRGVLESGGEDEYMVLGAGAHGQPTWYETRVTALRDNDEVVGVILVATDITKRKSAEAELADRDAMLSSVFAAAPIGIGITKDRILLDVNDRLCAMLGASPGDLTGKSARILYPSDEEYERVGRVKYAQIEERGVGRVETTWVRGDGTTIEVLLSSAPLEEAGSKGRVVFTALDITDSKAAQQELLSRRDTLEAEVAARTMQLSEANEELLQANRAKSDFLAAMSHELRTPLNSIIGFTGVILDELAGPVTEEQRRQLEMVRASGDHLLELVNDILDLSKVESGDVGLQVGEFSLCDVVDTAIGFVRNAALDKGLELEYACETATVVTDSRALQQIVLNLLSNAVKFTDVGTVWLEAGVEDGWIVVSVSDTGRGIPPESLGAVFSAFQQVGRAFSDGSTPRGTGLGLALSKRLAERLGGGIDVESQVGLGSKFTVRLLSHIATNGTADG